MTLIEQLDFLLRFLADSKPLYEKFKSKDLYSILVNRYSAVKEEGFIESELISLLEKLSNDGYVTMEEVRSTERGPETYLWHYSITFNGVFFIRHEGGYSDLINQKNSDRKRILLLEDHQKKYQRNQTILTVILVIGSSIAAIYYGIEVCKFFHWTK